MLQQNCNNNHNKNKCAHQQTNTTTTTTAAAKLCKSFLNGIIPQRFAVLCSVNKTNILIKMVNAASNVAIFCCLLFHFYFCFVLWTTFYTHWLCVMWIGWLVSIHFRLHSAWHFLREIDASMRSFDQLVLDAHYTIFFYFFFIFLFIDSTLMCMFCRSLILGFKPVQFVA